MGAQICATVNKAQSNGWLDNQSGLKRFSMQLDVNRWMEFEQVVLSWPGESIHIDHVYNAQLLDSMLEGALLKTACVAPAWPCTAIVF
jgi:hypothetical protein